MSEANLQEPEHLRITYNEVHNLIRASAAKIAEWKPDMLIAIGVSSAGAFYRKRLNNSISYRWRASSMYYSCLGLNLTFPLQWLLPCASHGASRLPHK